jgi:hypothetical protein
MFFSVAGRGFAACVVRESAEASAARWGRLPQIMNAVNAAASEVFMILLAIENDTPCGVPRVMIPPLYRYPVKQTSPER